MKQNLNYITYISRKTPSAVQQFSTQCQMFDQISDLQPKEKFIFRLFLMENVKF